MAATATSAILEAKIRKGPGRTGVLIFLMVLRVGLAMPDGSLQPTCDASDRPRYFRTFRGD